jgi:hypothetical protein
VIITSEDNKKKIPEVVVGQVVHSCGADGFCVATIIAGLFSNFEEEGALIAHVSFPAAGMPTVCNHSPIKYHKPENKEDRPIRTWHLMSECVGGCKRMDNSSRILH